MHIERGSLWHKWDFHVHTPYSILNNQFGIDLEHNENGFDEYVKRLFTRAIEEQIAAIGITDYFSIDGYKRIKKDYLNNEKKLNELFPEEQLRAKIKEIFIFPNIELRLDSFVGEKCASVNYHVIFSDKVEPEAIEENFLQRLEIIHKNDKTLILTKNSIELIGQELREYNNKKGSNYRLGLEQITVNHTKIMEVLSKSDVLHGKYLISIPVDEDLSKIQWDGRDYQTRKVLYQESQLLMTSNIKTRDWALAKGHEPEQISEFGSIKPCIWGSDAHSFERLFNPHDKKYCWLKADTTFEGLQQILFEPEDRVKIQENQPEEKDPHQIIDSIKFEDDNFMNEPIYISEGLTTIIGGKSTGKSILLHHIANCIDPNQVKEREEKITNIIKLNANAKVTWKDGISDERKIIYIPQSWLNRIVDENTDDSQLNNMLRNLLFQDETINNANILLKENILNKTNETKKDILCYVEARNKIQECDKKLREFGRTEAFQSTIENLEQQRETLSKEAGITEEILKKYSELENSIAEQNKAFDLIKKEKTHIDSISKPFVFLPNLTTINSNNSFFNDLNNMPFSKAIIDKTIQEMNDTVAEIWFPSLEEIQNQMTEQIEMIKNSLNKLQDEYEPLKQIIIKNEHLKQIEAQLQIEKFKFNEAKSLEDEIADNLSKTEVLMHKILELRETLKEYYSDFVAKITNINISNTNLRFYAEVLDKKQELFDAINSLFNNRNFKSFKDKFKYSISDKDEMIIDNGLFKAIFQAINENILTFKGGNSIQSALERLFSDWFYIHYLVKSDNDTINKMSPGKKALVLLEMIVNIEKSKCPILIDQPEDDLDNRSIYTDLVQYLKTKKHERQIIVVTHNANVVIGADAEEVIIANQNSKESPNRKKRFEYRAGAIENNVSEYENDKTLDKAILYRKGIQEQICDILEGGREAFELRRKKYITVQLN